MRRGLAAIPRSYFTILHNSPQYTRLINTWVSTHPSCENFKGRKRPNSDAVNAHYLTEKFLGYRCRRHRPGARDAMGGSHAPASGGIRRIVDQLQLTTNHLGTDEEPGAHQAVASIPRELLNSSPSCP